MNTSNTVDFAFASTLSALVIGGLVMAGMASAIIAGAAMGGVYFLATN